MPKNNEQAFPGFKQDEKWRIPAYIHTPGMSKRFYAACAAMQGLLSNPNLTHYTKRQLAETSYGHADELLKQEKDE